MKKFFLLFAAIVLLCCSCGKLGKGIEKGTYSASVTGLGMLNMEIISDSDCILYFTGGPESSGYYHIDGEEIKIIGHVYTTDNWGSSKWDCLRFSSDNPGKVYSSTSFGVDGESQKKDKMLYCSFKKRN